MSIAVVAIAKNEDRYIEEWVQYYLKLGFDKIYLYENNWKCLINHDNLIKIPFAGEQRQMPAYNHFLQTYASKYDCAGFFDIDEVICLKKHNNIQRFLHDYDEFNGVALNWVMFTGKVNGRTVDYIDGDGAIKRFVYRETKQDVHCKFLLNLNKCGDVMIDHPHFPRNITIVDTHKYPYTNVAQSVKPNIEIAQLNHYYYKTYPEFVDKCNNGRADVVGDRPVSLWNRQSNELVEDYTAFNFLMGDE